MKFALNENGNKIEPVFSGQRAICPGCKKDVVGKIYSNKINHWAHLNKDCDNWYEPMTDWHLSWQNKFPIKNQEVIMVDENTNEFHRADIQLNNGVVIEIQNSPIVINEVKSREQFYGKKGLIWILNAQNLIPKVKYESFERSKKITLQIILTVSSEFNDDIDKYFFNLDYFFPDIYFVEKYKHDNEIQFFYEDESDLSEDTIEFFFNRAMEIFNYKKTWGELHIENTKVIFVKRSLEKKNIEEIHKNQWRKFIDQLNAPTFIDNISGLPSNYLFWLQKNKKIKKDDFLAKYLKYT